ncbi:hypothetical protein [Moorena producens]|uniref:hypothetical protein n=1 Tax=Moorena producens TaxID=1155739 RepID=UPI001E3991C2|nr:hypothetical protein [Moorena producens]
MAMPASPAPTIAKRILPYPFSFFTYFNIFWESGVGNRESGVGRCRVGSAYFADDQVFNWVQPLPTRDHRAE